MSPARHIAHQVLVRIERDGAYAAPALSAAIERAGRLDARDRALATEIVYGVERWRGALDAVLGALVPRGLGGLDVEALAALRSAAYQILRLDRIPAHAAVDEAVEIVKRRRGVRLAGFANAVLRRLASERPPLDPALRLPAWIRETFERAFGAQAAAILAADDSPPPTALRANVLRVSRDDLVGRLRAEGFEAWPGDLSALAVLVGSGAGVEASPSYAAGLFTVQDEGAQVVALGLGASPGERVLDACAGRGGKTGLIAAAMADRGRVDCADRDPRKLRSLASEMQRLGIHAARPVAVDLAVGAAGLDPPYDRILLDAPCTGLGTLRRRPEIRWRLDPRDPAKLAETQRLLFARTADLLAPGGRLVYAVCSLAPDEGPLVVDRTLAESSALREISRRWLLPSAGGSDGFFVCTLTRATRAT